MARLVERSLSGVYPVGIGILYPLVDLSAFRAKSAYRSAGKAREIADAAEGLAHLG